MRWPREYETVSFCSKTPAGPVRPFVFLENFITIEIFVNNLIAKKLNLNRGDVHKMVSQLCEGVVENLK